MKRSVLHDYNQLEEKLTGYVAMLNFKFLNLCVKAEEASLLPVTVNVDGASKKLEEVAVTAKKDEYRFIIVPHIDEDMEAVGRGILMSHPDFKQDVESLHIEAHDAEGNPMDRDVPYILLTMPEVDDERYDFLKQAVDTFYQQSKTLMDKSVSEAKGLIAMHIIGEPEEEIDGINKAVEKLNDEKSEQRDKLRTEKLQEIEEAHRKWQTEHAQDEHQNNGIHGENSGRSMRFGSEEEM